MRSNKFVCQLSAGLLCLLLAGYAQAEEVGVKPQNSPLPAQPAMVANPALAELLRDANALVKSGKALAPTTCLNPRKVIIPATSHSIICWVSPRWIAANRTAPLSPLSVF